jgi:hypothetical protein
MLAELSSLRTLVVARSLVRPSVVPAMSSMAMAPSVLAVLAAGPPTRQNPGPITSTISTSGSFGRCPRAPVFSGTRAHVCGVI